MQNIEVLTDSIGNAIKKSTLRESCFTNFDVEYACNQFKRLQVNSNNYSFIIVGNERKGTLDSFPTAF